MRDLARFAGDGCVVSGRLSRLDPDGTEHMLIEDWCNQFPTHSIGKLQFGPASSRRWLRQAVVASFVSGALWGLGTLFLLPEGQVLYQVIFPMAGMFMAVAAMFSYAPHNPTFLAYMVPAIGKIT